MQFKRMHQPFLNTCLSRLATTGLTALLCSSTNSGFAALVPALSADSFVDSIGVNVHLTYGGTPYEQFEDLIKPKLKEVGIRHIRNGAYQESDFFHKVKSLAADGVKATRASHIAFSASSIDKLNLITT